MLVLHLAHAARVIKWTGEGQRDAIQRMCAGFGPERKQQPKKYLRGVDSSNRADCNAPERQVRQCALRCGNVTSTDIENQDCFRRIEHGVLTYGNGLICIICTLRSASFRADRATKAPHG